MKCPVCHGELQDSSSFCPYCGTRLDWTGSPRTSSSPSKHIGAAIGLIVLLVAGSLFAPGILVPAVTRLYDDARGVLRELTRLQTLFTNSPFSPKAGEGTYGHPGSMILYPKFLT